MASHAKGSAVVTQRSAAEDKVTIRALDLPREPDPQRFSGAAQRRYKDVYQDIATGKTAGLSIGGAYTREGADRAIKHWALGEVSINTRH